jgi:hypothetical protein
MSADNVTPIRPEPDDFDFRQELRTQVNVLQAVHTALSHAEDEGEITGDAASYMRALGHVVYALDRLSSS